MAQLVMTVLAIALTALLMAGGVTYFSSDTGTRIETVNTLNAQHSAIIGGLSSYRTANNGHVPGTMESFAGYMPEGKPPVFPRGSDVLSWRIAALPVVTYPRPRAICIERGPATAGSGIRAGLAAFANDTAKRHPGEVRYGASCETANEPVCPGEGCKTLTGADFVDAGTAVTIGRL